MIFALKIGFLKEARSDKFILWASSKASCGGQLFVHTSKNASFGLRRAVNPPGERIKGDERARDETWRSGSGQWLSRPSLPGFPGSRSTP